MGKSGSKKVTIGYRYYLGMHMVLAKSPIDKLIQINASDYEIWPASAEKRTMFLIFLDEADPIYLNGWEASVSGTANWDADRAQLDTIIPGSNIDMVFCDVHSFAGSKPPDRDYPSYIKAIEDFPRADGKYGYIGPDPTLNNMIDVFQSYYGSSSEFYYEQVVICIDISGSMGRDSIEPAITQFESWLEDKGISRSNINLTNERWLTWAYDGAAPIAEPCGAGPSNETISIFQPKIFGGDKKEGGVIGDVDLAFGASNQSRNSYLQNRLGNNVPAFRGVFSAILNQVYLGMHTYIKPWSFLCRRTKPVDGWKEDLANISGDMNAIHIIRECLLQVGEDYIDNTSFENAAYTIFEERFGLSIVWDHSVSIEEFIQEILDHIEAIIYIDPITGKFNIKLIRDDYEINELPVFDESNIIEVDSFSRRAKGELINSMTIKYTENLSHDCDGKDDVQKAITLHNTAAIQRAGEVISEEREFHGLSKPWLANYVLHRELLNASTQTASLNCKCNREAFNLRPGSPFVFKWDRYGVEQIVMRAMEIDYGTLEDGVISVKAVQDLSGYASSVFGSPSDSEWEEGTPPPSEWEPPIGDPQPITKEKLIELPYQILAEQLGENFADEQEGDEGLIVSLAGVPGDGYYDKQLYTGTSSGTLEAQTTENFNATAKITEALIQENESIIIISDLDAEEEIAVGNLAYINEEIVLVKAFDEETYELTIARGMLDTIPQEHDADSVIFFDEQDIRHSDEIIYVDGQTVYAKNIPRNLLGPLNEQDANEISVEMNSRMIRPLPPGNTKVKTCDYPNFITGALELSWSHRDRVQQTAYYVEQSEGDIGPEDGVTYELHLVGEGIDKVFKSDEDIIGEEGETEELWTPAEITTALWLDAADSDSITEVDGAVSQWDDKSGNDRHATQATGANQPALESGVINDKDVIRFNGSSTKLGIASFPTTETAYSAYAVLKSANDPPATTAKSGLWRFQTSPNPSHYPHNNGICYMTFGSNARKQVGNLTEDLSNAHVLNIDSASASWQVRINGTQVFSTATNTVAMPSSPIIGESGGSDDWWFDGDIGELIVAPSVLSEGDRQRIEGYLAHKWGLTDNLPAEHPYKMYAPGATVTSGFNADGTSFSLPIENEIALSSNNYPSGIFNIELKSIRDLHDCWQSRTYLIDCAGYGMLYGDYYGESQSCGLREGEIEWTPAEIDTALWLDAADADTITLDASDNVEQWDDKSGNDDHFMQSTANERPSVVTNGVFFDNDNSSKTSSGNQHLRISKTIIGAYPVCVFGVFDSLHHDSTHALFASARASVNDRVANVHVTYDEARIDHRNTTGRRGSTNTDFSDNKRNQVFGLFASSTERTIEVNGGASSTTDTASSPALSSGELSFVGMNRDYNSWGARGFGGVIREIIVLQENPSIETKQRIEGYLAHKWGLTANLPSEHPYKLSKPTI